MKILKKILASLILITLIFKLPEWHYNYIRSSVGEKVVEITNKEKTSGGTGFHIKAPSGRTYILTNSHICSHIGDNGIVQVSDTNGNTIPRRIILDSDFTDLCIVEAMPGAEGLSLGSEVEPGQIVAAVGHPKLLPLTMSRGEIIGVQEVSVLDHIMADNDPKDKCDLPKNRIEKVNLFGLFEVQACVVQVKAYLSNATILPGNSGSPVVNFWGNVVGVVFAGDGDSNWGDFVTLSDINKLLRPF